MFRKLQKFSEFSDIFGKFSSALASTHRGLLASSGRSAMKCLMVRGGSQCPWQWFRPAEFPNISEFFRMFQKILKSSENQFGHISWPTGTRLAPMPSWRRLPWDCSTTIESNCYLISNRKLSKNSDFSENSEKFWKFWNPPAEQSPEGGACITAEIRCL